MFISAGILGFIAVSLVLRISTHANVGAGARGARHDL